MATINHVRLARLSAAFARECGRKHHAAEPGHAFGAQGLPTVDRYTRRSNICVGCNTARALLTGECLCG